jgi:hypothetical protein
MNEHDATEIAFKNGYEKAVKEIFAEIEREVEEALKSNYKVLPGFVDCDELYHMVQGKISALRGIEGFIEELKKKYAEEK